MIERFFGGSIGTNRSSSRVSSPQKIETFLDAYEKLCREHGLSLAHEDSQGGFEIEEFSEDNIEWVRAAAIGATLDEHGNSLNKDVK